MITLSNISESPILALLPFYPLLSFLLLIIFAKRFIPEYWCDWIKRIK